MVWHSQTQLSLVSIFSQLSCRRTQYYAEARYWTGASAIYGAGQNLCNADRSPFPSKQEGVAKTGNQGEGGPANTGFPWKNI